MNWALLPILVLICWHSRSQYFPECPEASSGPAYAGFWMAIRMNGHTTRSIVTYFRGWGGLQHCTVWALTLPFHFALEKREGWANTSPSVPPMWPPSKSHCCSFHSLLFPLGWKLERQIWFLISNYWLLPWGTSFRSLSTFVGFLQLQLNTEMRLWEEHCNTPNILLLIWNSSTASVGFPYKSNIDVYLWKHRG